MIQDQNSAWERRDFFWNIPLTGPNLTELVLDFSKHQNRARKVRVIFLYHTRSSFMSQDSKHPVGEKCNNNET
jgi:hypothetical protein